MAIGKGIAKQTIKTLIGYVTWHSALEAKNENILLDETHIKFA